jgi:hypothetical protein
MDSLERAKRFLTRKGSRLALTVLPLAALAIAAPAAKAATTTLISGSNCVVSTGTGACATAQEAAIGGNTGLNWVGLFTSGGVSSSGGQLMLTATGGVTGSEAFLASGNVPVAWDFNILPLSVDPTVDWTLTFQINFSGGGSSTFTTSANSATGDTIQGSGSISTSGGTVDGYSISLHAGGPSDFQIDIPNATTLDLNPPLSAVPEPSSLLVISVAGALMILRRKKRA